MRTARSKKYWAERAAKLEAEVRSAAGADAERVKRLYERAVRNINGDIEEIFQTFAKYEGIDEQDARKLITAAQAKDNYAELRELLDEVTDEQQRKSIQKRIDAHAYGARMSRFEAVKERIFIELKKAGAAEYALIKRAAEKAANTAYYTTIHDTAKGLNCGIDFSLLPKRAIKKLETAEWLGSNYSSRVWKNNDKFVSDVQRVIEDGITAGHSVDRMARQLTDWVNSDSGVSPQYVTERLVRTETAHFMNEGQAAAYEEIGAETYLFLAALSSVTCDTCAALDNRTFRVSEREPGVNFPPIHPNCRCTTIIGDFNKEGATRIARDPLTGKNYRVDASMNYSEWKASLTDEQRQAMDAHVREMRNRSADTKQYEKYKAIFGKEFPKNVDSFQDLKYNNPKEWESFKARKQDKLNSMDFKDMDKLVQKLGNKEVRLWYKHHDESILNLIDTSRLPEQQARQACDLRNTFKYEARELMKNQELRKQLDKNEPYKTFEELVTHKREVYGLSGDDIYKDILRSSGTTNKGYDKKAGVD